MATGTSTGVLTGSDGLTILEQISLATMPAELGLNTNLLSRTSPALRILQEKSKTETGNQIRLAMRHNRNTGGWYAGYDDLAAGRTDAPSSTANQLAAGTNQFSSVVYPWRNTFIAVSISEDQLVENASMNIGDLLGRTSLKNMPERDRRTIFNIFGKEVEFATEDMSDRLANSILNLKAGSSPQDHRVDVTGLADGNDGHGNSSYSLFDVLDAGSFGGLAISDLGTFTDAAGGAIPSLLNKFQIEHDDSDSSTPAAHPKWQARTIDLALVDLPAAANTGDLTRTILGLALHDCAQGGTDGVDYIIVSPNVYVQLEQALESAVRRDEYMSNIGFLQNMEWGAFGATIVADPFMPSGNVIGINTKHTFMIKHESLDTEFSGFKTPTNKATIEGQLKLKCQLVCDDRAKNFWIKNVTKVEGTAI